MTKTNIIFKRKNLYDIKLDSILTSYDSVIANIKNMPDLNEFKKIETNTFEELLDVYNEVRMPINFYESHRRNKAIFMIINDNMCWEYILDRDSVENNDE